VSYHTFYSSHDTDVTSHRVLIDDTDVTGRSGGGAYERFGIDTKEITMVIVRPDGYVGMIAPSTALESMDKYFGSFLIVRQEKS
jgi:phenol 2-monooxygenase